MRDVKEHAMEHLDRTGNARNLIDLPRMLQRFDHDVELIREVMAVFVSETPERSNRIAEAQARGDLEQLVRLAHSLKGVCGTMHAEPLRELSCRVEMAARAGDARTVGELVPRLLAMLRELSHYLGTEGLAACDEGTSGVSRSAGT